MNGCHLFQAVQILFVTDCPRIDTGKGGIMDEGTTKFNISAGSGSGNRHAQVFLSREGKKTSERDAGGCIIR